MEVARKLQSCDPRKKALVVIKIVYAVLVVFAVLDVIAWWRMELAWTALMDSSDFVDWSPLNGLRLLGLGSIAALFLASANVYHFCSVREWTRRQDVISVTAAIGLAALTLAGFVGVNMVNCPEADPAAQLSDQLSAVESFNVAACNAWCVAASSKTLTPVCRLEEMPTPSAAFDSFAAHAGSDLEPWCRQAVGLSGRRELFEGNRTTPDFRDCSPFCRLKMRDYGCVSSAGWQVVLFIAKECQFLVGWLLAGVVIGECCRRAQRRMLERNDRMQPLVAKVAVNDTA